MVAAMPTAPICPILPARRWAGARLSAMVLLTGIIIWLPALISNMKAITRA